MGISQILSNVDHLMCLLAICMYVFFGEKSILTFCPFFDWVIFLDTELHKLSILEIKSLLVASLANVGGNVNWCSHYGEQFRCSLGIKELYPYNSLKKKKRSFFRDKKNKNRTTIWPSNPIPRHTAEENHNLKRYMYSNIHCSTIYNSQDMEAT